MSDTDEFSFVIDAFTPSTLPMARLAEYLREFSALLGSEPYVHFERIGSGSAALKAKSDPTASPKIRTRLEEVLSGTGPKSAMKAHSNLNDLLRSDNAIGHVKHGTAKLMEFPGRRRAPQEKMGPVRRPGSLDGQIYQIGGKDETINIHLRDGDTTQRCEASISLARRLAPHFLGGKVRLIGEGDWYRTESGWQLSAFTATDFVELDTDGLSQTVEKIRRVFKGLTVDAADLSELRRG